MVRVNSCEELLEKLAELCIEIENFVPDVPGKQRLLKYCRQELQLIKSVVSSQSCTEFVASSNYTFVRGLTTLCRSYGPCRLIGIMCRFKLPFSQASLPSSITFGQSDFESNAEPFFEDSNDSPNLRLGASMAKSHSRIKREILIADLVVTQYPFSPGTPTCSSCFKSGKSTVKIHGNAENAPFWAPSFWIKFVARDAKRINSAWNGKFLSYPSIWIPQLGVSDCQAVFIAR
ncbi:unnamed protein product [Protopolystoma xenopodis]|uniref:Uncharacterized protein n=1 Tax=Protopolystoma xenopodis TaxID=117903 RepID=A0A448WBJ2_9PLAT|nr:unnamed protein product [Protopolystoma xenopodis]